MNQDKIYTYDDRPCFESYNMVNMPYPTPIMPMMNMTPNNFFNNQNNNNLENRLNKIENSIKDIETKIQRLENSIYPKAMDYNTNYTPYQNSMNIM